MTTELNDTEAVGRSVTPGTASNFESQPLGTPTDRSSWVGRVLAVLGILAAGVALGWLVFGGTAEAPVQPEAAVQADETPQPVEPALIATDEPVADVAEALLPSVVQIQVGTGIGSGVIFSDGLILTAAHVVDGSDEVTVRLASGDQVVGEVLGGDSGADIAVVRVESEGLTVAPLATEDPRVGQLAIAIGSPFGLDSTVTSGVVSAIDQTVGFQALIQTDAAINPGNSGGALANRAGEVIGINVSIFSQTGGNDGVGFAVPIDEAVELAGAIVNGETISTAFLGIRGDNAVGDIAGALIVAVEPGSAAETAGIEVGDIVTTVDGVRVLGIGDLAAQIRTNRPGEEITLEVLRAGETIEVVAMLGVAEVADLP